MINSPEALKTISYYKYQFSGNLPPAELDMKLDEYSQQAVKNFDASKGASFSTHLSRHLEKIKRDIHSSTSTLKSSEEVGLSINKLGKAKDELYMTLGREPTDKEISDATKIPQHIVTKHLSLKNAGRPSIQEFKGVSEISVSNLLPDLSKSDNLVASTIEQDMSTSAALKHTGLKKTIYYRRRAKLADRMKSAFLRTQTQEL